eukprot:COSAG01_NODE_672_length_14331_cov_88.368092_8_plen_68_part_00
MPTANAGLTLTLVIEDIAFGDGSNGVDITLKAVAHYKVTVAGFTFNPPAMNLQKKIDNVVDLDKIGA